MCERQVVSGGLLVARGHSAIVFEAIHETFDEIAAFILAFAEGARMGAIAPWRNDRFRAALLNRLHQFLRVVALVGNHRLRLVIGQQLLGARHVVFLAGAQAELHRLSLRVYRDMQFGAETAPRTTEALLLRRFFSEPAAC